jgi:hypothetical protein
MVNVLYEKMGIKKGKSKDKQKEYTSYYLSLPSNFVTDSLFPFKPEDDLMVAIEGDHLVVKKDRQNAKR